MGSSLSMLGSSPPATDVSGSTRLVTRRRASVPNASEIDHSQRDHASPDPSAAEDGRIICYGPFEIIDDYMDNVDPYVAELKSMHSKLSYRSRVRLGADFLNYLNNMEWASVMRMSRFRDLRYNILENLPLEILHDIADFLDPADIIQLQRVSRFCASNFSTPKSCSWQLASHFGIRAAGVSPQTAQHQFKALSRRWHSQKFGRPFTRASFVLPPCEFHWCSFDYHGGRLAMVEHHGGFMCTVSLLFLSTMQSVLLKPLEVADNIRYVKLSNRILAYLSSFYPILHIFDLGTPSIRFKHHVVNLPSNLYRDLHVVNNKVAVILQDDTVAYWSTKEEKLRTYPLGTRGINWEWFILHPTQDLFLTVHWEHSVDRFGDTLDALVTNIHHWSLNGVRGKTIRTPASLPFRGGSHTEYLHQPLYHDNLHDVSMYSMVNDKDSQLAVGLVDFIIDTKFGKEFMDVTVDLRLLNTAAFHQATKRLPSDHDAFYHPGGLLTFTDTTRYGHFVYDLQERNGAIRVPDYHVYDDPGLSVNGDVDLRARYTFGDGTWLVMISDRHLQIWSFDETKSVPRHLTDRFYEEGMELAARERAFRRRQIAIMQAAFDAQLPPRRYLLEP